MEPYGTEEEDISGFDTHTQYFIVDTFIVLLGPHMGFVDNKKNKDRWQTYPYIAVVLIIINNTLASCGQGFL